MLSASNADSEKEWHAYIAHVYRTPVGQHRLDLNTFNFFYRFGAVNRLFEQHACLAVCISSLNDQTYNGTPFVGQGGPDLAFGSIGFFVFRPPPKKGAVVNCERLEVHHMMTNWNGGEQGASWFFYTVGSGIFLNCANLPTSGNIETYTDRPDWALQHHEYGWSHESTIASLMHGSEVSMLVFTHADLQIFGPQISNGANPRTEIIVRHRPALTYVRENEGTGEGCLDDFNGMHIEFNTGLDASLACHCRKNAMFFLNCEMTPRAGD